MSDKKYVSIFVKAKTRDRLKVLAIKLGYPSMISFLEEVSKKNDLPKLDTHLN